jgi:hypothetical protein
MGWYQWLEVIAVQQQRHVVCVKFSWACTVQAHVWLWQVMAAELACISHIMCAIFKIRQCRCRKYPGFNSSRQYK